MTDQIDMIYLKIFLYFGLYPKYKIVTGKHLCQSLLFDQVTSTCKFDSGMGAFL